MCRKESKNITRLLEQHKLIKSDLVAQILQDEANINLDDT
jgi:hypothetical protein